MRQPGHKPGRRKEKEMENRCLKFECRWHGTSLDVDAPFCDYCYLHAVYNIPYDPPVRGCEPGEGCDKYNPGKYIEHLQTVTVDGRGHAFKAKILRRQPPEEGVERLKKILERMQKEEQRRENREKLFRESEDYTPNEADIEVMYEKNFCDSAIARALGCSAVKIKIWRELNSLPEGVLKARSTVNVERIKFYHARGLSNNDIATLCRISHKTVAEYLGRMGLESNYAYNNGTKSE